MRKFRFGVQHMKAQSGDDWRDKARRAEAVGYATMVMPDHFMWDVSVFPALQAAADATTTLHVGSMVLCNDFRHPVVTARDAASLQLLSGGRFELGIGAGWHPGEYEQVGIPFDAAAVRIERLEESLQIMRSAFGGKAFDFTGKHYAVRGYEGHPVTAPPPFVIGGGGRRMLGVAGRNADVVSITYKLDRTMDASTEHLTDEALAKKVAWVREGAGARFDGIELCLMVFWAGVTDDPLKAIASAAESMGLAPQQALDMPPFLFGSEAQVTDKLQRLREQFGISYFVLSDFGSDLASLEAVVGRLAGQ